MERSSLALTRTVAGAVERDVVDLSLACSLAALRAASRPVAGSKNCTEPSSPATAREFPLSFQSAAARGRRDAVHVAARGRRDPTRSPSRPRGAHQLGIIGTEVDRYNAAVCSRTATRTGTDLPHDDAAVRAAAGDEPAVGAQGHGPSTGVAHRQRGHRGGSSDRPHVDCAALAGHGDRSPAVDTEILDRIAGARHELTRRELWTSSCARCRRTTRSSPRRREVARSPIRSRVWPPPRPRWRVTSYGSHDRPRWFRRVDVDELRASCPWQLPL